jgi:hypothetical protein
MPAINPKVAGLVAVTARRATRVDPMATLRAK